MNITEVFSAGCLLALKNSISYAEKKKHEYVSVDTYLLFLIKSDFGKSFFNAMGLNLEHYDTEVTKFIEENIPKSQDSRIKPELTVQLQELHDLALELTRNSNKKIIEEGFMLLALFSLEDDDSFSINYFNSFEINKFDLMSFISHGKQKTNHSSTIPKITDQSKSNLHKFAILLNEKAKKEKIDPVIGREKEIKSMIEILCQKKKNNPLLVGEAGVGKTAIIEGLAKLIEEDKVPPAIKGYKIYMLDLPSILAGTRYRGDFEERLKHIIKEAAADPTIVLAIDDVHTLIGTGAGNSAMDSSNILKPALSNGEIKLIGATTYEEYRQYFEKDGAFSRRFKKIDIVEPSSEETIQILKNIKPQYETFHGVTYEEETIPLAVQLSVKYINDKFLPDKAFDIIDLSGSRAKINDQKTVTIDLIKQVFSDITRIPVDALDKQEKNNLKDLESQLNKEIFGQEQAIHQVVDSIILSRSNIIPREKPIGSFLLAGSSGVGKTELSKQISKQLNIPLIRFDMSEYMEKHAVSKLIGSPPGYVGFEQGGLLVEQIKKNPHCVLLLDEIEKAHPDIMNALLQVMDYASITDNNGRKADFKNVIIMMTTNIGANEINKAKIGFDQQENTESVDRNNQIKKMVSPEFFNRLDAVIQFNPLRTKEIRNIVLKQINQLKNSLKTQNIFANFDDAVIDYVVEKGYDAKLGARPIQRFIEKEIVTPLSKEILFGNLINGGNIQITCKDKITFVFSPFQPEKKKPTRKKKILQE